MKSELDCLDCIMGQALRAARTATSDPALQRAILDETSRRLPTLDLDDSPASISMVAYEVAAEIANNPDPFKAQKQQQNALAQGLEMEMREMIAQSDDPLHTALHLAAAGNVIDLGIFQEHEIDLHGAIEQVLNERFAVDHSEAFRAALEGCNDLLYLLDNAGEIVFDKLLIEVLLRHTPVTAVVKAGPMINDVTLQDTHDVGLSELCPVIDNGGAFIGSPLNRVPQAFLDRMHKADVIIGKGQGNYETIDDFDGNVFLILRAKCPIVARHMGVAFGQVGMISTRLRAAAG
jgi:hypothetical protein